LSAVAAPIFDFAIVGAGVSGLSLAWLPATPVCNPHRAGRAAMR
jgi:hypothetical protein